MTDPFSAPPATDGSNLAMSELLDLLLLVYPTREEEEFETKDYGAKPAIFSRMVILDGPAAGETHDDVLTLQTVLVRQFRPAIGRALLGRMGKGEARGGNNAPYKLLDPTEADKDVARRYLSREQNQETTAARVASTAGRTAQTSYTSDSAEATPRRGRRVQRQSALASNEPPF